MSQVMIQSHMIFMNQRTIIRPSNGHQITKVSAVNKRPLNAVKVEKSYTSALHSCKNLPGQKPTCDQHEGH